MSLSNKALALQFLKNPNVKDETITLAKNIRKARRNLLDFVTFTKSDYQVNWHHKLMCDEIDDFLKDPNRKRLMVFVGPRRGKSEIISRRLPAYAFGLNPNLQIIATSYGADLASAMNRDVQRVMDSAEYKMVFPNSYLNSRNVKNMAKGSYIRTSDKFELVNNKGAYRSAGVGGAITGMGADLAIIDDPLKDWKEAMSPVRKQAVYDWYTSTLYTRLSAEGKVILVLTRWAEDDLAGRLLKEAEANSESDQWEVISLPEMFDTDNPYVHPLDPRSEGDLLWPEKYNLSNITKVKNSVGSKVWASLFQQQPSPGDGTTFKSQWFKYYDELPEFDYKMASWDCTFNDSKGSDFVAGTVWGVKGANKYLLYVVNERLSFTNTLKEIIRVNLLFPDLKGTIIENKANGPAIISVIESKIPKVLKYTPTDSKVARAEAVSPSFEAGNIWLPNAYYKKNRERFPWMEKHLNSFIEQFKAFPFGKNDDMVDSTTQFLLKDGNTPQWLQDLANKIDEHSTTIKPDEAIDASVAEIMGWDIQDSSTDVTGWKGALGF